MLAEFVLCRGFSGQRGGKWEGQNGVGGSAGGVGWPAEGEGIQMCIY